MKPTSVSVAARSRVKRWLLISLGTIAVCVMAAFLVAVAVGRFLQAMLAGIAKMVN
jgi:hypothetical protein